ncbi:unnamed protein product, partial [Brenthis ino]
MDHTSNNIMFYEICRLCLDERGCCDIFDKNNLRENIYKCIGLKISLSDTLPQKICEKCLDIVNKALELRKIAIKNDRHLKSLFYIADDISDDHVQKPEQIVNSPHIDGSKDSSQKHPAIQTFIKVRKDLFESSYVLPQDESDEEISQVDNSQKEKSEVGSSQDVQVKLLIQEKTQYKCDECKKVFDRRKKLYLHSRLHNKNLPCPTRECKKKFATKGDLEKHIRTHTGEKPYKCDICDKGFAQRGSLKAHKESVHANDNGSVMS